MNSLKNRCEKQVEGEQAMGYFNAALFFMLFGALISPDLKAQHKSGYLELNESEAAQYTLCQPGNFNRWYLVARGEDLSKVISGIKASLEGSSSAEGSSTESGPYPDTCFIWYARACRHG